MKSFLPPCLRVLLVLAALAPVVRAQSQPANVTVEFTAISLLETPITDLVYQSGGQFLSFKAPPFDRSAVFKYTGPATLGFYRMLDKDGKKQPVAAANVELPPKVPRVLLVVAGSPGNYTLGAVDDSLAGFAMGKARLCNATAFKLSIKCNDTETVELAPGASKIMTPTKTGDMGVEVAFFKDNRWIAATSNSYAAPANGRLNIFLLTSDNNARFLYPRAVQIFILTEKAAAPVAKKP